jgi:hypothetical protein
MVFSSARAAPSSGWASGRVAMSWLPARLLACALTAATPAMTQPAPTPEPAGLDGKGVGHLAVDGDGVADPACHGGFHGIAEFATDAGVGQQPPVAENPQHVPIDVDWLPVLDHERPVEAASDLLVAALVRMVPIGPRAPTLEFW